MRSLILLLFFLWPSIAQATIGTATSTTGVLDSRAPEIMLISPQEGDLLAGGHVNFEWEIAEDSPTVSLQAVVLTVQANLIVLFQQELPFYPDGHFALTWNPTEQLPEDTFWHVAAVDFYGNTSSATSGPFTTTDVLSTVPATLSFGSSFPNPFNPRVVIRFSLPREQDVRLCIFDLAGREVAVPVVGRLTQGWHEVAWNAKGMASGPYMARLESGGEIRTIKLTLLK
jgi:hypothetical protein